MSLSHPISTLCRFAARTLIALSLLLIPAQAATITVFADGSTTVELPGLTAKRLGVEASSNLLDWQAIADTATSGETVNFTDPDRSGQTARFYRFFEPPFSAPLSLQRLDVHLISSILGTFRYTVLFNGASSGTFIESESNNFTLFGTFTYVPNGTSAHLVLFYGGEFQGDYDDMNLEFREPPQSSLFTGTQKANSQTGVMQGDFTYE